MSVGISFNQTCRPKAELAFLARALAIELQM